VLLKPWVPTPVQTPVPMTICNYFTCLFTHCLTSLLQSKRETLIFPVFLATLSHRVRTLTSLLLPLTSGCIPLSLQNQHLKHKFAYGVQWHTNVVVSSLLTFISLCILMWHLFWVYLCLLYTTNRAQNGTIIRKMSKNSWNTPCINHYSLFLFIWNNVQIISCLKGYM
jgi:hypothetical protein